MPTTTPKDSRRSAFSEALRQGKPQSDLLEQLVAGELAVFERQYRCASRWTHYDPELPRHDEGLLLAFAAVREDRPLWLRLVEHAMCRDHAHRTMQMESGASEEEHLGAPASMERSARGVLREANAVLSTAGAAAAKATAGLTAWVEEIEAQARAAAAAREAELSKGQRLRAPAPRIRSPSDYPPDLKADWERVHAELLRRLSRDPKMAASIARGSYSWSRTDYPEWAAAFDRIDDEADRRAGTPRPRILVKPGDKVYAHGKHWTVESVFERTGVVYLGRSEGTTSVSIPVDADGLEPER